MTGATLTIDGRSITVHPGTTLLQAAAGLDIEIPTLCHDHRCGSATSCMVCVVRDVERDRLLPACTAPAEAGMTIDTTCAAVQTARRENLELLLSEHVGDCQAPCQRICPAHIDIPGMIRQLAAGRGAAALAAIQRDMALPAVLGRICPAPCERGCRRGQYDAPVAIGALKRCAGDAGGGPDAPPLPVCSPDSGQAVAVIGAGPAGLSAAWHLRQHGHGVTLFEAGPAAGGALRRDLPAARLPRAILDQAVARVLKLGIALQCHTPVEDADALAALRARFAAVVLAVGVLDAAQAAVLGLPFGQHGLRLDHRTEELALPGLFAIGSAVRPLRLAVQAEAQGKEVAREVHAFLGHDPVTPPPHRFNCTLGKFASAELEAALRGVSRDARTPGDLDSPEAVRAEAGRCLRCDCAALDTCRLRRYAQAVNATPRRYQVGERPSREVRTDHPEIVFEPGKCIRCGICVRLTAQAGIRPGLTFLGRGEGLRVAVPFGGDLAAGLGTEAATCVEACPTGALSWKERKP